MKPIPLPEYDVVPLDHIADGVAGLRVLIVNVFAVSSARGWTLIDTGLALSAWRIERWVEQLYGRDAKPDAIVLTHGHFDHVGAAEELAERWNVPVYVSEPELPYVVGRESYPPPDPTVGGGLMALLSALYPRGPYDLGPRARMLPDLGQIPTLPDWRWIPTPGHSRGHVSLFRERDRTLLAGDALCTTKQESFLAVALQRPELQGPPTYFTTDWTAARRSVERLATLEPMTIAPGHGRPISGTDVAPRLHELADRFDEIAVPERGRYVEHPVR